MVFVNSCQVLSKDFANSVCQASVHLSWGPLRKSRPWDCCQWENTLDRILLALPSAEAPHKRWTTFDHKAVRFFSWLRFSTKVLSDCQSLLRYWETVARKCCVFCTLAMCQSLQNWPWTIAGLSNLRFAQDIWPNSWTLRLQGQASVRAPAWRPQMRNGYGLLKIRGVFADRSSLGLRPKIPGLTPPSSTAEMTCWEARQGQRPMNQTLARATCQTGWSRSSVCTSSLRRVPPALKSTCRMSQMTQGLNFGAVGAQLRYFLRCVEAYFRSKWSFPSWASLLFRSLQAAVSGISMRRNYSGKLLAWAGTHGCLPRPKACAGRHSGPSNCWSCRSGAAFSLPVGWWLWCFAFPFWRAWTCDWPQFRFRWSFPEWGCQCQKWGTSSRACASAWTVACWMAAAN